MLPFLLTPFTYISNVFAGIFERHKLLFSFQMDIKLEQSEDNVSQGQLDFFIKGNVSLEKSARACPALWIPSQVRTYYISLLKFNSNDAVGLLG